MRYRRTAVGVAGLLVGLAATFAGAQQITDGQEQFTYLWGGSAADQALRFDPFSLNLLPPSRSPKILVVTPYMVPLKAPTVGTLMSARPVVVTQPSAGAPATASDAASTPAAATAIADKVIRSADLSVASGGTSAFLPHPAFPIPYRPVLRSPSRP